MKRPGVARTGLIVGDPHRRIGLWMRVIVLIGIVLIPVSLEILRVEPPWRVDWFDMLSRTFPREAVQDSPVRVVVLQDAPGGEHLQGTWPRDRLARLVDVIGYSGAKAIGLDIPLDGVGIYEHVEEQAEAGAPLEKSQALADAIRRHNVVAPVTLLQKSERADLVQPSWPDSEASAAQAGLDQVLNSMPKVPVLQASISAHPLLRSAAKANGLLIDDLHSAERLRSVPLTRLQETDSVPTARYDAMAIEMIRLGQEMPRPDIDRGFLIERAFRFENGLRAPMDVRGNLHLFLRPLDSAILIDGDDVIFEQADPAQFRDRYVVVTTGYGGFSGRIDTTLFRHGTTGEITAQIIEQILTDQFIYRPAWMPWAEIGAFVLAGVFFVFLFARYSPARVIPVCTVAVLLVPALCAGAYAGFGVMIDGLGFSTGVLIIGAAAFGTHLVDRDQDYHITNLSLTDARADKARLEGELDVARRIQMSLLPPETARFSGCFEIACHIEPAQEVGGDFYDYVERPDGQVFFSIGDVSGKGVPASLFMALSKSLWKSAALINAQLSDLQEQANRDITRDNRDQMFVTGVGCLFDPATRTLRYCGAGHDMPVIARKGEAAVSLESSSGPPLGLDNGLSFPSGKIALQPGDLICLFTDGLTEAELSTSLDQGGSDAAFFGVEGIEQALDQAARAGVDAGTALRMVLEHLAQKTAGSSQADDRTLVVARYAPDAAAAG